MLGRLSTCFVVVCLFVSGTWAAPRPSPPPPAASHPPSAAPAVRSVILLIGDGMAAPQLYAARAYRGVETGVAVSRLNIDTLPVLGTFDNHSDDALVTDAAAAATALATGARVPTHVLSLDASGKAIPTIFEQVRAQGRATGLVTTVTVSNAMPAAFVAHAREHNDEFGVAAQFGDATVADVVLGGGREYFLPLGADDGKRADGRNIVEMLRGKGYKYVIDRDGLLADHGSPHLIGLFDATAMAYDIDRDRAHQPSLAEMTEAALRSLSTNPKGFVLMVCGGKIDWAGHSNDLATVARDTLAFDDAVGVALDYQKRHPDTLVLVTADHETGGLTFPARFEPQAMKIQHASVEHVLESLPARELDPNSEAFLTALRERLGIVPDVPLREKLKLAQASPRDMLYVLTAALTASSHAAFSTSGHSALPPLLAARGPGQASFGGSYDIIDIYARLARLLKIKS